MEVILVTENKEQFMELLLLGDEQEDMIQRYLPRCDLYSLYADGSPMAVCAVTREADTVFEVKNLATREEERGKGYGSYLLDYVGKCYQGEGSRLQLGTGDVPGILDFYRRCGFQYAYTVPNFFTDNYDHPMYEDGHQLVDMVYLERPL